jgi:hypothetical protein
MWQVQSALRLPCSTSFVMFAFKEEDCNKRERERDREREVFYLTTTSVTKFVQRRRLMNKILVWRSGEMIVTGKTVRISPSGSLHCV